VIKSIPPDESAITSLALDPRGRVLGATSGKRSHLFIYDPDVDRVVDLCVVDDDSVAKNSLVICPNGTVFVGTRKRPDRIGPGKLLKFKTEFTETLSWELARPELELIGMPKPDEGIACLAYDQTRDCIYGLTSSTGTLFSLDVETCSSRLIGPVDEFGEFSDCLITWDDGHLYGGKRWGYLFEFDPEREAILQIEPRIPSLAGRQIYNRVDSMTLDQASRKIYGGGTADGILFAFDPGEKRIISLGKPTSQPRTRAITVGRDGKVYGMAGRNGGAAHLFRYDPATGDLRDLGIPLAHSDQYWHGYEFDSMVIGKSGEIYMGESDRISHLFIYYPPF